MLPYATQPLGGWRNESCAIPITVPGLDLTGVVVRAQVRLASDTPGAALLDLEPVTDAAATGIRFVNVTRDAANIPTTHLMWQVSKTAMQGLPYAGEVGDAWVGAYGLQIGGVTRLTGAFAALASAIDSDSAPGNRPMGWGGAAGGSLVNGVTLTIGDSGVAVVVYGLAEVQAALALAVAARDAAIAARDAATAARDASGANAAKAATNATTADTAKVAVLAAIGQVPSTAVLTMQAPTRDILRGFTNMAAGAQAYLGETGMEGMWIWREGDYFAQVAADPNEGLYLKATAYAATAGAWCRVLVLSGLPGGMIYRTTWWGVGDGFVDTAAVQTFDGGVEGPYQAMASVTLQAIANLLPDGSTLSFPAGTINLQAVVQFGQKGVTTAGVPGKTWITTPAGSACFNDGAGFFRFNGSNSRATGMGFRDLATTQAQVSPTAVTFAGGAYANRQGNPVTNIELDHCIFLDCSAPCIVYDSSWKKGYPNGYQPTKSFHSHHNIIRGCDYEYQSLYTADDVWWHDNYVECVYKGRNREFYGFRCIGGLNVHIYDNRIVGPGYARQDARAFNIKSGISYDPNNPLQSKNVHIYNNDVENWPRFADVSASTDRLFIQNNRAINTTPPTDATAAYGTTFFNFQASVSPLGLVVIEENTIVGYDALYYLEYSSIKTFRCKRNNLTTPGRSTQPSAGFATVYGTDIGFFDICDNVIAWTPYGGGSFLFKNTPAATFGNCWGNVVPEPSYPAGDARQGPIVAGNVGKVVTSPGTAPQDFAAVPVVADGTNVHAAAGTWAALNRVTPNP